MSWRTNPASVPVPTESRTCCASVKGHEVCQRKSEIERSLSITFFFLKYTVEENESKKFSSYFGKSFLFQERSSSQFSELPSNLETIKVFVITFCMINLLFNELKNPIYVY